MNILHIVPSYYPAFKYGGPIESVYLLNKALVKQGIKVTVLTTNAGLENRKDIVVNKWIDLEGVKVKYLPYYFYEHYTFSPQLFFDVLNNISKYDLVHITAFWNFPVLAGSIASILNKKPYIISPRGVLYEEAINIKSKCIKKLYFSSIGKHYLNVDNGIHFTTQHELEGAANCIKINTKSFVVPNGLDFSQFANLPAKGLFKNKYPVLKDKKYILFLGRINKQKGLDILSSAFSNLANDFKDLFLVIAGPDEAGYKKELIDSGLSSRVIFTGMLTDDKLSAYVDAEAFVLPSYFENFGMSVVEAMACGTPVVISNKVGIYREVQASNSGIVVETNAGSLYKGIKNLLDNPNLCNEIRRNARRLVEEKYNIEVVADLMINAYKEIINHEVSNISRNPNLQRRKKY